MEFLTKKLTLKHHLYISFIFRCCLIIFGHIYDNFHEIKFTDVDYRVFTDAARYVKLGQSPYFRHTYRYTPYLSWMLLPCINVHPLFGKFLFCATDIFIGYLIYVFVNDSKNGITGKTASFFWLYNPVVAIISARGNADSIVVASVLVMLYLFKDRLYFLSGISLAIAINFKIYPIIYCLPLYNSLTCKNGILSIFDINKARFRFVLGVISASVILLLGGYYFYGMDFFEHTFLYHIGRKDIRHNFSIYCYMLYLTVEDDDIGMSILTFMPQIILLLLVSWKFGNLKDLPFCLFCQTYIFVMYNKVITTQYFIWYLSFIPLILNNFILSKYDIITTTAIWWFSIFSWLLPAYFLEMLGQNTFGFIWVESITFFCTHACLLAKFLRKYNEKTNSIYLDYKQK